MTISIDIDADDLVRGLTSSETDELLRAIDEDDMISFISNNFAHSMLKALDESEICGFVARNVSMAILFYELDQDDQEELKTLLKSDEEPDQPDLNADEWDMIKQGLKAIIAMRNLIGAGPGADARGKLEQLIIDKINDKFPS